MTFGIVARRPETGYGYILRGTALAEGAWAVERFVEKPALEVAEAYVANGDYDWNSGMFLFRASRYLELKPTGPTFWQLPGRAGQSAARSLTLCASTRRLSAPARIESIDYAVMEKTQSAVVVRMDGVSDVGAFAACCGGAAIR